MFTKGLASTGWSHIPLWNFLLCYISWSADTLEPLAAPPLFAVMSCLSCQVSLWSAYARLCKATLHLTGDREDEFLETNNLAHCVSIFAFPTVPLNFNFKAYNNCFIRQCWVRESQLPGLVAMPYLFFLHSSLIIHSFIVYNFCFTAFIIHLLNYGWYIHVCYSRAE